MKKILLSLVVIATCSWTHAQVVVAGVSPASIVGNYDFANTSHPGWPTYTVGSTTDENWNMTLDFGTPGIFVMDTIAFVEDGTPGTNPQGNPISQEGCNPLTNSVAGKIAMIYRNTCDFASKAKNAQDSGAVAVIIINREDDVNFIMTANAAGEGPNVTIPVCMITATAGAALKAEMASGPVVMFIGNKISAFPDDVGLDNQFTQIARYGAHHNAFDATFDPGVQFINWGQNAQADVTVTANIDGPSGASVYNESVGPFSMAPGDTLAVFNGFANSFPTFTLGTYPDGEYTLSYDIDLGTGTTDAAPGDNTYESRFTIQDSIFSRANLNGGVPNSSAYPSNTDGEYQSCMMFQEPDANQFAIEGLYFTPFTDTSVNSIAGEEILVNAYVWDDPWADLNDAAFQTVNGAFTNLTIVSTTSYIVNSEAETGQTAYAAFNSPFILDNTQRYLFCVQTFTPYISFGYDGDLDYDGNINVLLQPVGPILVQDDTQTPANRWFSGGWNGSNAPAIGMKYTDPATISVAENSIIEGIAYPNPTTDEISIEIDNADVAEIVVTDLAGKVVLTLDADFTNGVQTVSTKALQTGMYIFNVSFDNGSVTQFNVMKK